MPGFVLHEGATVLCMHGGQAQPTMPSPRVLVAGQSVTTRLPPYTVTGCGLTGSAPPCVLAQWTTAATRVKVSGMPLLLQDSRAICTAPGTGLLILLTQLRVQGT